MPYGEREQQQMRAISEAPAFREFAHEIMNDLAAALGHLYLLESPETPVQAEMFRARAIEAVNNAVKEFREIS